VDKANYQIQYTQGADEFAFYTIAETVAEALVNFADEDIDHDQITAVFFLDDEGVGHEVDVSEELI